MDHNELKKLYSAAYGFLLRQKGITENIINEYLVSESIKPNDLKIIYHRFCESAQNRQMSNKVIGKSIGGINNLSKVLYNFNPFKVVNEYSKNDNIKLLNNIENKLNPIGQIRLTSKSLWPQYCQSVIDSAYFLTQFKTANNFYKWADIFANNSNAKPALPVILSIEITGIGFPLACDILKELGYSEFGKPDVHLKDIFKALHIINPNEKSVIKQDYETFKAIDNIAHANNISAYAVDKIFWLIGSGNFYLSGYNIGRQKQNFIKQYLNQS